MPKYDSRITAEATILLCSNITVTNDLSIISDLKQFTMEINGVFISEDIWIKGRIRNSEFLRMFTVAFLLFLAPAVGSNTAEKGLR